MDANNQTAQWRRCPNCGSETFYIQDESKALRFLRVTAEGRPVARHEGEDVSAATTRDVYCTSCAWYGTLAELEGPATP